MNKELPTDTITMDNVEKIYDFIFQIFWLI